MTTTGVVLHASQVAPPKASNITCLRCHSILPVGQDRREGMAIPRHASLPADCTSLTSKCSAPGVLVLLSGFSRQLLLNDRLNMPRISVHFVVMLCSSNKSVQDWCLAWLPEFLTHFRNEILYSHGSTLSKQTTCKCYCGQHNNTFCLSQTWKCSHVIQTIWLNKARTELGLTVISARLASPLPRSTGPQQSFITMDTHFHNVRGSNGLTTQISTLDTAVSFPVEATLRCSNIYCFVTPSQITSVLADHLRWLVESAHTRSCISQMR